MKSVILAAATAAAASLLGVAPQSGRSAAAGIGSTGASDPRFFPVEQAVAGTPAVARTVFRGDQIEEFPLEIIGRFRNFAGPGQDVILAKLLGDKTSFTGVAGGMSGSPVYVEGKLLGALSYRIGNFSKEPIAGITPIADMLRAAEFPAKQAARSPDGWPSSPSSFDDRAGSMPAPDLGAPQDREGLVPIGTPVFLGGFSAEIVDRFAPRLRGLGLEPVRGGTFSGAGAAVPAAGAAGSSPPAGTPAPPGTSGASTLRPGDPIAAILVDGDLSVAAAGTLTHVDGNRLYAFGHPFLQTGSVDIPAARATILWTLSSWLASNKLAEIGPAVGAIREDRLTAVVGELGAAPRMIPVTVDVDSSTGPSRHYSFQIARAKALVPLLVNLTLSSALTNSIEYSLEATGRLEGTIDVAGFGPIRIQDALAGDASSPVGLAAASRVTDLVQKIYENPFRDVELDRVAVRLSQAPRLLASAVDRAVIPSDEIRPGVPYEIRLQLRNFRGAPSVESASLTLPPGTLSGPVVLLAGESRAVEAASGTASGEGRLAASRDFRSYLERLSEEPRGGWLTLRLVRPARGASVRSESLPDLPPSVLSLLSSRRGEKPGTLAGTVLWERTIALEGPVAGLRSYALRIGRAAPALTAPPEGAGPPRTPPEGASPDSMTDDRP